MNRISRRTFVRRSLAGSVGLAMARADRTWAHDSEFVPAIVIGSGFGGAVAALRLASAGVRTVVLERGRRWPIRPDGDTFATFDRPDGRASWLSPFTPVALIEQQLGIAPAEVDIFTGVLEGVLGNGINVATGAGVGGGSLVNNAVTLQPRRELFERAFPKSFDYDEMSDTYYRRARSIIGATPVPDDLLQTPFFQSTLANLAQVENAGFATRLVDLAIDWDVVRKEIAGMAIASAIAGQSWYGLNSGAKRSLDRNYLALTEATGHAEILPLHQVDLIREIRPAGLYAISVTQIDENGAVTATRRFVCRYLFLGAGSIGTTKLLLKSKAAGALPRLSDAVGLRWGNNGDVVAVRNAGVLTNPGTGGTAGHFIAEDLENPFAPTSLVEVVTPRHLALAPSLVSYITMGLPPAAGEIAYDPLLDRVSLRWPSSTDPRIGRVIAGSKQMIDRLNAANDFAQPRTVLFDPTLGAHPLGGATFGRVCDEFGRVKGHPGLYVVDGALIPGVTGLVNPSLTIAAVAERCLDRILDRDIS